MEEGLQNHQPSLVAMAHQNIRWQRQIGHPKRNVAKTYVERADWHKKFIVAVEDRRERLNEKLTVEELVEEHEDQLGEVLAFIHALTPEQLPRTAQQFKDGLDRVMAARERNRERAKQMLAKQGVRCE